MQADGAGDYLAGLWRSNLATDLLWNSRTTGSTFFGEEERHPRARHSVYHAPSWSWASVTGPISFASFKMQPMWEIMSANTTVLGANLLGCVSAGILNVKSSVAEVRIEMRTHINNRNEKEQVRCLAVSEAHPTFRKLQEVIVPDVGRDEAELEGETSYVLIFAAVEQGWSSTLILKQVADERTESTSEWGIWRWRDFYGIFGSKLWK